MNKKTTKELQRENIDITIKDGIGLKYGYNTWIVAKDTKKNKVLIGGLGGMGVGEMWFDFEDRHKDYPNFNEAPERSCNWE